MVLVPHIVAATTRRLAFVGRTEAASAAAADTRELRRAAAVPVDDAATCYATRSRHGGALKGKDLGLLCEQPRRA